MFFGVARFVIFKSRTFPPQYACLYCFDVSTLVTITLIQLQHSYKVHIVFSDGFDLLICFSVSFGGSSLGQDDRGVLVVLRLVFGCREDFLYSRPSPHPPQCN